MGKILAIKGDKERGNEVIALLEMLGGNNSAACGDNEKLYYFIGVHNIIDADDLEYNGVIVFTLDEFYKKYPYKLGDKVERNLDYAYCFINKMRWNSDRICVEYHLCSIYGNNTYGWHVVECFNKIGEHEANNMNTKLETPVRDRDDILFDSIIWHLRNSVNNGKQYLSGGECETYFRELIKKVKKNNMESCNSTEFEDIEKVSHLSINDKEYADEIEINLGDDYEYKFEMNRLYILKKKLKYPETYKECCDVLNLSWNKWFDIFDIDHNGLTDEENNLYESLIKLKRCRDAYWKIAGTQMGLGKPWEPNWNNTEVGKHCIFWDLGDIDCDELHRRRCLLAFPTEEMRDAFYENFKDLIEECKELL